MQSAGLAYMTHVRDTLRLAQELLVGVRVEAEPVAQQAWLMFTGPCLC